jgi:AcrR family transcriptional regulator
VTCDDVGEASEQGVSPSYNPVVGLRETKKLRTRREISDRAMQLFALRGFDRVTVAEVAAAAGVSEKTVFNYFPTKPGAAARPG